MPVVSAPELRDLTQQLLRAAGTPEPQAEIVAGHLVEANLTGHDSHGVIRMPWYLREIESGRIVPNAEPTLIEDRDAIGLLDGGWGFGHVATRCATEIALAKAKR